MSESVHSEQIVADVPCPFCACLCDDLELTIAGGRIVAAKNACELARPQFLAAAGSSERAAFRIAGRTATLQEAITRATEILLSARYPLVWGLGRATCEAQAAAVELAERLGGVVDASGGDSRGGHFEVLQTIGEITCTLGEVRSRADLIVAWRADPVAKLPRFFERYAPQSLAKTSGCPLIAVDSRDTPTTAAASRHLKIRAGSEFESATVLWALAKGLSPNPIEVAAQTGVPLAEWRALVTKMEQSRYGAMLFADSATEQSFLPPLFGLVRTLNDRTRWVSVGLGCMSNGTGAEQVLTWRTGYPRCVDFSQGFPRYDPTDFAAARLLERGEVDVAILVCDDPETNLSKAALARLRQIPTVSIDWKESAAWPDAAVSIRVAMPGVESSGTMFRLDGVPLALRPAIKSSDPADFEVLRMLTNALRQKDVA